MLKTLRNKRVALQARETGIRKEHAALMASAREAGKLTDEQRTRDDAIKAELATIAAERESLDAEIANLEVLAEAERATVLPAHAVAESVRESVQDDPRRGFPTFGHFAAEVYDCGPSFAAVLANPRLMAAAGTPTMQQGVRVDGGVLIPPAYSTEIWDGARQMSDSLLQYCDVTPVDPGVQSITMPGIDETSRADGSRWGGIRGYWKDELTAMTGTKPKFREVKIEPQELYVFGFISDKLLRHAPGAASAILTRGAADEINFKIGAAVFNGDGVGKPAGFLSSACAVEVAKETGQAAATIVRQNIRKMWARLHPMWRAGAVWFMSVDAEAYLEEMTLDVGTGGVPVYLPPGGVADAPLGRIKGRPVVPIEYASALGTSGDIVLASLGVYRVGVRAGIDSQVSMHLKFDYAQTAFRFITEIDGQSMLKSALTPFNGGATLSAIVKLATRS